MSLSSLIFNLFLIASPKSRVLSEHQWKLEKVFFLLVDCTAVRSIVIWKSSLFFLFFFFSPRGEQVVANGVAY